MLRVASTIISRPLRTGSVGLMNYPVRTLYQLQGHMPFITPRVHSLRATMRNWMSKLRLRYCMWKLRRLLGKEFEECDFLEGARQAATLMIEAVNQSNWSLIRSYCTDQGACVIYGHTQSEAKLNYSKLVRFKNQHLCHVVPIVVNLLSEGGRLFVVVDLMVVGLRNMGDFENDGEQQEVNKHMKQLLEQSEIPERISPIHQRIALGEFLLTLRREVNESKIDPEGWLVDYFKLYGFKLVNYSPVTLRYCIIDFLKPA